MKKLLVGLAILVVVVIGAALVAPFLIPTDTYKGRLIALVKDATGRDLRIAGPVRLSLLPAVAIEAGDVALSNARGAHDPDMVKLRKLEIELRILPLLHGEVELGRFVLTGPEIALEIDKDGKPNWIFTPASSAGAAPAPAARPGAAAPAASGNAAGALSELSLDDVRLVDGKVSYRDDRTGKVETLDSIQMKVSLPSLDSRFTADGSATWHDQRVAVSAGIAKPRALFAGKESGFGVKIAAAPVEVGFTGSMTGLPPAKLGGTIDLTVPSVRDLAKWAGAPLAPGPGLQRLAIKGRIDMAGSKISFSDADLALDAISGKGSLAVDTSGARPALKGSLALDTLDINPYLPPESAAAPPAGPGGGPGGAGSAPAAKGQAGWSDDPIDLSGLHAADVDFDLKAGAILYRKIKIDESALTVHLKDAKLTADLSRLALYQGQGQGKVAVDGSGAVPQIAADFALTGVQVEPLLVAAAGTDRLAGTAKLNFDVTGIGKSQRALVAALNGKGAFDIANGELKGVNLVAMAQNATSPLTGASADNHTSFGDFAGTCTITNGILKNDDLKLKSGLVPITGAGTVDLPNRTVDYRVKVSLAGAIGVPILVSGPWDGLSYRPDLAGALSGAVKAPGEVFDQLRALVPGGTGGSSGSAGGSGGTGGNPINTLKNLFGK